MTPQFHARVSEIFLAVVDRPPQERPALLDRLCTGDADLRRAVEELLSRDESVAAVDATVASADLREALAGVAGDTQRELPRRIGAYEIIGVLGQGGMGTVYAAQQTQPSRRVALKVINPALLTPRLVRRFEFEAQVLAELQHPGIAQIFEAGSVMLHGSRVPFFAMELVDGLPLTAFADSRRLPVRGRLALLKKICHAVHHAHQKGVIHRDLKPANILVSGTGEPKILDFGVARATAADLRNATLQTQPGQILGTLAYMSPERFSGDVPAVDVRSDVYALGVVAYELLSGRLPFRLHGKSVADAARLVETGRPEPLSRFDRRLRGDIETIVGRAMHPDIHRRYPSADELGREIERYLAGHAIEARRDSGFYVLRKALARHRVSVAVGLVFVFLLTGAAIVAVRFAFAEARQRREAERTADALRQTARFQSRLLRGVDLATMGRDLKSDLREQIRVGLDHPRPGAAVMDVDEALGAFDALTSVANPTDVALHVLRKHLLRAAEALEREMRDQPQARAEIALAVGASLRDLGLYDEAEPHLRSAVAVCRAAGKTNDPDLIDPLTQLALVLHERRDYPAAEALAREALGIARAAFGESDRRAATALVNLAAILRSRGQSDTAEALYREALAWLQKSDGENSESVGGAFTNLGDLLRDRGDVAAAVAAYREALRARRGAGRDLGIAASLNNLADLLTAVGRTAEAEPLQREALEIFRSRLGDEHPHTAAALGNLAETLRARGDLDGAEQLFRQAGAAYRRLYGADTPEAVHSLTGLGLILQARGDLTAAEPLLRRSLAVLIAERGERDPDVATAYGNLAALLHARRDYHAAEPVYRQALTSIRSALGERHPRVGVITQNFAAMLRDSGDACAAEPLYREAVAIFRVSGDVDGLGRSLSGLGRVLTILEDRAAAEDVLREALDIQERFFRDAPAVIAITTARLGAALVGTPGQDHALPLLTAARVALDRDDAPLSADLDAVLESLARLYESMHNDDPNREFDILADECRARLALLRSL